MALEEYLATKSRNRHSRAPSAEMNRALTAVENEDYHSVIYHDDDMNDDYLASGEFMHYLANINNNNNNKCDSSNIAADNLDLQFHQFAGIVEKEGWLWRKNQFMIWKKCFGVLQCDSHNNYNSSSQKRQLTIYKTMDTSSPFRVFDTQVMTAIAKDGGGRSALDFMLAGGKRKRYEFTLHCGGTEILLACETDRERHEWIRALNTRPQPAYYGLQSNVGQGINSEHNFEVEAEKTTTGSPRKHVATIFQPSLDQMGQYLSFSDNHGTDNTAANLDFDNRSRLGEAIVKSWHGEQSANAPISPTLPNHSKTIVIASRCSVAVDATVSLADKCDQTIAQPLPATVVSATVVPSVQVVDSTTATCQTEIMQSAVAVSELQAEEEQMAATDKRKPSDVSAEVVKVLSGSVERVVDYLAKSADLQSTSEQLISKQFAKLHQEMSKHGNLKAEYLPASDKLNDILSAIQQLKAAQSATALANSTNYNQDIVQVRQMLHQLTTETAKTNSSTATSSTTGDNNGNEIGSSAAVAGIDHLKQQQAEILRRLRSSAVKEDELLNRLQSFSSKQWTGNLLDDKETFENLLDSRLSSVQQALGTQLSGDMNAFKASIEQLLNDRLQGRNQQNTNLFDEESIAASPSDQQSLSHWRARSSSPTKFSGCRLDRLADDRLQDISQSVSTVREKINRIQTTSHQSSQTITDRLDGLTKQFQQLHETVTQLDRGQKRLADNLIDSDHEWRSELRQSLRFDHDKLMGIERVLGELNDRMSLLQSSAGQSQRFDGLLKHVQELTSGQREMSSSLQIIRDQLSTAAATQESDKQTANSARGMLEFAELRDEFSHLRAVIEPRLAGLQEDLVNLQTELSAKPEGVENNSISTAELSTIRQWLEECRQQKSATMEELKQLEELCAASRDRASQQQISFQTQMSHYEQLCEAVKQMRSEQHQLEHDIACKKDQLHDLSMRLMVKRSAISHDSRGGNGACVGSEEDEEILNERIKNLLGEIEELETRKKTLRVGVRSVSAVSSSFVSNSAIGM